MVRPILRPLFNQARRGFNTPQGRMFTLGTLPVGVDLFTDNLIQQQNLVDQGNEAVANVDLPLPLGDENENISTDIDVTSKDPEPEPVNEIPNFPGGVKVVTEEDQQDQETVDTVAATTNTGISNNELGEAKNSTESSEFADYLDNDSVKRINSYKNIIKNFLDDDGSGDKLQRTALLLQIGSALMSGRTDQPGLRGFFDIVGRTGMEVAPTLFEMGVERGKNQREINAAALDLYFEELENQRDVSGPYVAVYQNYKLDSEGDLLIENGAPVKLDVPKKIITVKRTSPGETNFYNKNQFYGLDVFSFVEQGEGTEALGIAQSGAIVDKSMSSGQVDQIKYGNYVFRALPQLAEVIPLFINNPGLTGTSGAFGKVVAPLNEVFKELTGDILNDDFDFGSDPAGGYGAFTVNERANGVMIIDGKEVPVFYDYENKFGGNNVIQDRDGSTIQGQQNGAQAYMVKSSFEKLLESAGEFSTLQTFETTLGLMLARDRQPTGRMLADVLRRSFEDVQTTGIGGRGTDRAVIQNYVKIYNTLYNNAVGAYELAGLTNDKDKADRSNGKLIYDPDRFVVDGVDNLADTYYKWLRSSDQLGNIKSQSMYDIGGAPTLAEWTSSFSGNIQMDQQEDEQNIESIFNQEMELFQ